MAVTCIAPRDPSLRCASFEDDKRGIEPIAKATPARVILSGAEGAVKLLRSKSA